MPVNKIPILKSVVFLHKSKLKSGKKQRAKKDVIFKNANRPENQFVILVICNMCYDGVMKRRM